MQIKPINPRTRREKEIWQACDYLRAQYPAIKDITGDRIMDKLLALNYKRGCPNEIYKYRKSWWQARGISELEARGLDFAANAVSNDPLSQAIQKIQLELKEQAEAELLLAKQEFNLQVSALERQASDDADKILSLTIERNKLLVMLEIRNKTIRELSDKINTLLAIV